MASASVPPAAAAAAAAAVTAAAEQPPPAATSAKNAPHLHSVATSLRSCLDGMLPDALRNDAAAFQLHRASLLDAGGATVSQSTPS